MATPSLLSHLPRRYPERERQLQGMKRPAHRRAWLFSDAGSVLGHGLQSLDVDWTDDWLTPVLPWLSGTLRDLQGGSYEKQGEALRAQEGKVQPLLR